MAEMTTPRAVLDHLKYIKFRPYRRRTNAALRGLAVRALYAMDVLHEHNGSCCRRESWETTLAKLIQSLNDDGFSTLSVTA